jgi:hypothetical protein
VRGLDPRIHPSSKKDGLPGHLVQRRALRCCPALTN